MELSRKETTPSAGMARGCSGEPDHPVVEARIMRPFPSRGTPGTLSDPSRAPAMTATRARSVTGSLLEAGRHGLAGNSAARAASYSALSRATISAAGGASKIWPTPWPAPQMSRQALALVLPPSRNSSCSCRPAAGCRGRGRRRRCSLQVIAMHAGEEVGVDDLVAARSTMHCLLASVALASLLAVKRVPI